MSDPIKARREYWNTTTRGLIRDTLKTEAATAPKDFSVGEHPTGRAIYFEILAKLIDSMELPDHTSVGVFRINGALCYSLLNNGRVFVWHSFPYIEDKEKPSKNWHLTTLEPNEITPALIREHLAQFRKNITGPRPSGKSPEPDDPPDWANWLPNTHTC